MVGHVHLLWRCLWPFKPPKGKAEERRRERVGNAKVYQKFHFYHYETTPQFSQKENALSVDVHCIISATSAVEGLHSLFNVSDLSKVEDSSCQCNRLAVRRRVNNQWPNALSSCLVTLNWLMWQLTAPQFNWTSFWRKSVIWNTLLNKWFLIGSKTRQSW